MIDLLGPEVVVVAVPSSDPDKVTKGWHGISRFVNFLTNKNPDLTNGNRCLIRTRKIDKAAEGGDRSTQIHQETLQVVTPEKIVGKTIFLIDDVTSTGHSLEVAIQKFHEAGAAKVVALALGKTAPKAGYVKEAKSVPSPAFPNPSQVRLNTLMMKYQKIKDNTTQYDTFCQSATEIMAAQYQQARMAGLAFFEDEEAEAGPTPMAIAATSSSSASFSSQRASPHG